MNGIRYVLKKKLAIGLLLLLIVITFIPIYKNRGGGLLFTGPGEKTGVNDVSVPVIHDQPITMSTIIEQSPSEKGQTAFGQFCEACHGAQAQGGTGPALIGKDAAAVRTAVRDGLEGMPPLGTVQLSDAELENMIAFLSGLK